MPTDPVKLDEAAVEFAEKFGLALADAGVPRMPARIFAATLASPDGSLTAQDLAAILRISPAAVSGGVRYLTQVGLMQRSRRPGERRDHFLVRDDQWYEMLGDYESRYRDLLKTLDDGIVAVGPDTEAGKRLAETKSFFAFISREIPKLVDRWREEYQISGEES